MFHRDIQTPRRELKIRRADSIFDEFRVDWIADETLPRVFDISSQSSQGVYGEVKSSKSMLIKTGIQTPFAVVILFVLTC